MAEFVPRKLDPHEVSVLDALLARGQPATTKWLLNQVCKIGDHYYLGEGQRAALLHRFPDWKDLPPPAPAAPADSAIASADRAGRAVELE